MKLIAWFGEVDEDNTGADFDWSFGGDHPEENHFEGRLRASVTSVSSHPGTMAAANG
jgi:hypothetical protein